MIATDNHLTGLNEQRVSFKDLGLCDTTRACLDAVNWLEPTEIQLRAIPLARCGIDLVVQSKAGSGKTGVFAVVAFEALQDNASDFSQTIVVAPTRELASQIHDVIKQMGSTNNKFKATLCIGEIPIANNIAQLKPDESTGATCQIVVGTPGRLIDLIGKNHLKTDKIELFVLDEADKLMDDNLKVQVDEIYKRLPKHKQMIVTSATYPNKLSNFLQRYMKRPIEIKLDEQLKVDEFYVDSKAGFSTKNTIDVKFANLKLLLQKLDFKKCFIFTNHQSRAPQICDRLNSDKDIVQLFGQADYISAERNQAKRNEVVKRFRTSSQKLLVSTDVLGRGIDIPSIELVINFDLPDKQETYYHRIGRAGRLGRPGRAVSIVSGDNIDKSTFRKNIQSDRISKLSLPPT